MFALPALDGEVVDGQVHVIVANAVPLVAALSNATFEGHQVADADFCYAFMLFLEERDAVPDGAILPVVILVLVGIFGGDIDVRDLLLGVDLSDTASDDERSEEHTSEIQSLMRISYAVFCLKKKN